MNLSPNWCGYLNAEGHDAIHWSEVGPPQTTDVEIMRWASVLTNDLDFGAILAAPLAPRA